MGARVEVVGDVDWPGLQAVFETKAETYRSQGEKPFIVNVMGPLCALGAVAYVEAFVEFEEQCRALRLEPSSLFLAAFNMTPAGLALGAKLRASEVAVEGIAPIVFTQPRQEDIAAIATAGAGLLGLDVAVAPDEIRNADTYVGPGYGVPDARTIEAIRLAARTEGLLLDPVYTGKAFAGMLDHIATGRVGRGESIVFLHTGGQPALFAYDKEILGIDA
jgi:1-aminocyclopropane-1-carboxylate deaminase/D-cysteine desulfhydrase-like pyridoxal-dependent ACC family enzyme